MLSAIEKVNCFNFRREPFEVVNEDYFTVGKSVFMEDYNAKI